MREGGLAKNGILTSDAKLAIEQHKLHTYLNYLLIYILLRSKGGLISEDILTLVSLPTKGAKSLSWSENLNKLLAVMDEKFKFSF